MVSQKRNPNDFIVSFGLFRSDKLSVEQSITFFAGLSFELILDKNIFPKNSDLETFVTEVYLTSHNSTSGIVFKPYLYKSRTLLGARLTRVILDNFDYTTMKHISYEIERILLAMFPELKKSSGSKTKNTFNKNITDWITAISEISDNKK